MLLQLTACPGRTQRSPTKSVETSWQLPEAPNEKPTAFHAARVLLKPRERRLMPGCAPCDPILPDRPPESDDWLHEVKWDGYRAPVHIAGGLATVYSRAGLD
jgi:ATP-dependent DNA ligase